MGYLVLVLLINLYYAICYIFKFIGIVLSYTFSHLYIVLPTICIFIVLKKLDMKYIKRKEEERRKIEEEKAEEYLKELLRLRDLEREEKEIKEREFLRRCNNINELLHMYKDKPYEFEKHVAFIFNKLGYKTKVTKATGDGGKDIIMHKDGKKCVVEVKLYATNRKISEDKIRKLHSAKIECEADDAFFVTTSDFTKQAIKLAEKVNIMLINGHKLVSLTDRCISPEDVKEVWIK